MAPLPAIAFLEQGGFEAQRDDIIDALMLALSASHVAECVTLPPEPEIDAYGLRMEIVYRPREAAHRAATP